jgi:hypothetical protein
MHGPFGGGFYHLGLGWTLYGHALLGAPRDSGPLIFSALTSFPAKSEGEAKAQAARFGHAFTSTSGSPPSVPALSSDPRILIPVCRPLTEHFLLLRLYETSGEGAETTISFPAAAAIASATRCREDGAPDEGERLKVAGNGFSIRLGPGEVAAVRVELK